MAYDDLLASRIRALLGPFPSLVDKISSAGSVFFCMGTWLVLSIKMISLCELDRRTTLQPWHIHTFVLLI